MPPIFQAASDASILGLFHVSRAQRWIDAVVCRLSSHISGLNSDLSLRRNVQFVNG